VRVTRLAVLLTLTGVLVAAPASALFKPKTVSGNLDSDPAVEQLTAVRIPSSVDPGDDDLAQVAVDVLDTCPGGQTDQRVAGPEEALVTLRLVDADTRLGKEALIDMRAGASGRHGLLRLVSLRPGPAGGPCELPHNDFSYLSTRPTRHPRGANALTDFEIAVKDFSRRYRGKEVRLLEGWAKPTDALCCPSFEKTSLYRYDRKTDRYVRYSAKVKRNRPSR
jgi:hypothetical protein